MHPELQETREYLSQFEEFTLIETTDGYIGGRWDIDPTKGAYLTISRLFVYEDMRGLGIGEHLVKLYEKLFPRATIRIKSKPEAEGFWRKMGYEIVGEEEGYYVGYKTV